MATKLIQNGCYAGALAGIQAGRQQNSFTPGDYATIALIARAIANECITRNAALGVPMADADNTEIAFLCMASAYSVCFGWFNNDQTAADYLAISNNIVAQAKQCVAQLV